MFANNYKTAVSELGSPFSHLSSSKLHHLFSKSTEAIKAAILRAEGGLKRATEELQFTAIEEIGLFEQMPMRMKKTNTHVL